MSDSAIDHTLALENARKKTNNQSDNVFHDDSIVRDNKLRIHNNQEQSQQKDMDSYADGNMLENKIREKLDNVRRDYREAKQLGGEAKTLVKSLTPWGFFSLISNVNFLSDIPYFFAIMAATLKDGLDLVLIGSLPAIGTIVTACASLFIGMMMFLGNIMQGEHDRTVFQSVLLKQFLVLIFISIVEFVFGIDFLPAETIGTIFIYSFALAARKGRNAV